MLTFHLNTGIQKNTKILLAPVLAKASVFVKTSSDKSPDRQANIGSAAVPGIAEGDAWARIGLYERKLFNGSKSQQSLSNLPRQPFISCNTKPP